MMHRICETYHTRHTAICKFRNTALLDLNSASFQIDVQLNDK